MKKLFEVKDYPCDKESLLFIKNIVSTNIHHEILRDLWNTIAFHKDKFTIEHPATRNSDYKILILSALSVINANILEELYREDFKDTPKDLKTGEFHANKLLKDIVNAILLHTQIQLDSVHKIKSNPDILAKLEEDKNIKTIQRSKLN